MPENEAQQQPQGPQELYLPTGGAIPGIPGGEYPAGHYLVDYQARTIEPYPDPAAAPQIEAAPAEQPAPPAALGG